jgi:hypothetical protein
VRGTAAAAIQDTVKALQQSVRGAAMLQKGTVVAEAEISVDGHPAREYEVDCERSPITDDLFWLVNVSITLRLLFQRKWGLRSPAK